MSLINNSPNFVFYNVNKLEWRTEGTVEISGFDAKREMFSYSTTFSNMWYSARTFGDEPEITMYVNPLSALKEINVEGEWFYHDPNWTGNYNSSTINDITTGQTSLENNIVKSGLIAYYNFDNEYSNRDWSTANGTWKNLIENNYNIDIIGSSYINDNKHQPGIEFTGNDDYMNLPISIKDKLIGKDITISMWVKIDEHNYFSPAAKMLNDNYVDNNNRSGMYFSSDSGWDGALVNGIIEGGQLNLLYTKQQRWYEGWYNLTFLRPANGGRFETYVNGFTVSYIYRNNNPSTNGIVDGLTNITFNASFFNDAVSNRTNNKWGEIQIYNRLLTTDEIQTNYLARQDKYHVYNGINDSLLFHFDAWDFRSYRSNYYNNGTFNEGDTNWYDLTGNYHMTLNSVSFSVASGGMMDFYQSSGNLNKGIFFGKEEDLNQYVGDKYGTQYSYEYLMMVRSTTVSTVNRLSFQSLSSLPSRVDEISNETTLLTHDENMDLYRINNNEYFHIVLTRNGTSLKLYQNGRFKTSTSIASDYIYGLNCLGNYYNDRYFDGHIGLARLYNKELTSDEVSYNYNSLATRVGLNRTDYKLNLFCYYDAYTSFHGKDYGDVLYNWEDLGDFNNYAVMAGNTYNSSEKAIMYEDGKYIQTNRFRSDIVYAGTDWTVEIAVKFTSLNLGNLFVIGNGVPGKLNGSTGVHIYVSSTQFLVGIYNAGWFYDTHVRSYSTDTWYHFVIKKIENDFFLFEDGNYITKMTNAYTSNVFSTIALSQRNIQNFSSASGTVYIRRFRFWFDTLTDFECSRLYDDYSDTYL